MLLAAWYHVILAVIFAGLSTFLMFVVLLQRGKGVGLAGAFGGAGGQTVFGSKTGDVLTWATVIIAGMFLLYTIVLNKYAFQPQAANLTPAALQPAPGAATGGPPPTPAPGPADTIPVPVPIPAELPTPADTPGAAEPSPGAAEPEAGAPAEEPGAPPSEPPASPSGDDPEDGAP